MAFSCKLRLVRNFYAHLFFIVVYSVYLARSKGYLFKLAVIGDV